MYQYIPVSLFLFSFSDSLNTDQKKTLEFISPFMLHSPSSTKVKGGISIKSLRQKPRETLHSGLLFRFSQLPIL